MAKEITLDQLIANAKEMKKDIAKTKNNANKVLYEAYADDIKGLLDQAVQEFYDSYTPHSGYKRKKDLFNAYEVSVKNGYLSIKTGAQFMKKRHRADNDYIYNMAFVSGWHGGAPYINDLEDSVWGVPHPNPANYYGGDDPIDGGDLYWRTPMKPKEIRYSNWYHEPAAKSFSPLERIKELLSDYEKYGYKETLDRVTEKIFLKNK